MYRIPIGALVVPTSLPDLHRAVACVGAPPIPASNLPQLLAKSKMMETTVVFGRRSELLEAIRLWAPNPVVSFGELDLELPPEHVTVSVPSTDVVCLGRTGVTAGDAYVIGDVHNCHRTLTALLGVLDVAPGAPSGRDPLLVFVGDLVDKGGNGPDDVLATLRLARTLRQYGQAVFVRGNHEQMLMRRHRGVSAEAPSSAVALEALTAAPDRDQLVRLLASMPLAYTLPSVDDTPVTVVHATATTHVFANGVRAQRLAEQSCLFGKPSNAPVNGVVVHGHWETPEPRCTVVGEQLLVNVDTGACLGNKLTAFHASTLPSPTSLDTITVPTVADDVPECHPR